MLSCPIGHIIKESKHNAGMPSKCQRWTGTLARDTLLGISFKGSWNHIVMFERFRIIPLYIVVRLRHWKIQLTLLFQKFALCNTWFICFEHFSKATYV